MIGSNTWGIVLAGGEGTRVRNFLKQFCGGNGLKQFSTIIGRRSMLQHTLDRTQRLIPPARLLVVAPSHHRSVVYRQLAQWPRENIVFQPANRDTAPGILLPLAHISHRDPSAKVVVFPSDHFVLKEDQFMASVQTALEDLHQEPDNMVLLGMTPAQGEEAEYGYIEVGQKDGGRATLPVLRFSEKPSPARAKQLVAHGALWNTMVFAAHARTLWEMVHQAVPILYHSFTLIQLMLDSVHASSFTKHIYGIIPSANFSSDVCEPLASTLRVLPVPDVGWSDWGNRTRIIRSLQKLGRYDEFVSRFDPGHFHP